ncbi:beta-ketoacyl synthase chain length factor [Dongia sp.]|uniref:beta-ketoacyl synthase chain length factor n=1 Tax=Dongia sp. TaxID=1977262 RepID=UPI0035ADBB61
MPILPMMLRRRVSPIGQKALGAAQACADIEQARYIIASRHGEFDRTVKILTALAEKEQPSPAEFSMSVHHGLAGLLSIHTGNRQGHTAVAASLDSFGYGLIEAAACLVEVPDRPVLLIYFDAPLPESYADFRPSAEADLPLAMALTLCPGALSAGDAAAISVSCAPAGEAGEGENLPLGFLRFLLGKSREDSALGGRMVWRWCRA